MKIAILYFFSNADSSSKNGAIVKKLTQKLQEASHSVEPVCAFNRDSNFRLTPYDYVAVVMPCQGIFNGKAHKDTAKVLGELGSLGGKKSAALIIKSGFMPWKACTSLMRIMESEGMLIDYSDVVLSVDHAAYVSKKLG
ncbi:MAG: hypothetical protein Ta2A_17550 [Treponemataceae bacterium]|nr:MAG: hypothetical protein Ta2A_17550 [Treponemataceae bacterium]